MIQPPRTLRGRVILSGVALVTVVVLALDVFVYLSLREQLLSNLEGVLDSRAQLVTGLAQDELRPQALSSVLNEIGLRAIVRTPEGDEYLSAGAPPFSDIPAGGRDGDPQAARAVPLVGGGEVVVLASRGGTDQTLRRLLLLEIIGTVGVVTLAAVALVRTSSRILRPISEVAETARHIADGHRDQRLRDHGDGDELTQMSQAFNEMVDALEEALERSQHSEASSRRFLADAAHQLRTPAAGIRASVATALRTRDGQEREQMLDNLAQESARMSRLLSSLLRVARLDSGEAPERVEVRLDQLLDGLVERQRTLAPQLRYSLDVPPAAQAHVDASSFEEAVANLLDNARRYAHSEVRVAVAVEEAWLEVRVSDDGPGVPPQDRERVFDRFVSVQEGGSGLGLPIARGIARAHGGELTCDDRGFALRVPRRAPGVVGP